MKNNKIITRFPPSPTGFLHIGRARTALFNYLFAKKNEGKMVFRLEDTDKARSKKEYEDSMIESLKWLGISWDNEVIERQSERIEIYKKYLRKLVDEGKAYISKEKIEEGEKAGQENEVVRFRNPNTKITFTDLIRGDITFDTTELGDFIIARNIDEPLYHLTVVVDDFEMGITHIIRGDDGISNTPRQILIQQGIGAPKPIYAHLPLILAPDKSKLSGRHGAVSVTEYQKNGYIPQALINYLALLGWNPGTEQEIFSTEELIQAFDISKIQKAGAVFNIEKLNWFNKQYISKMSDVEFSVYAKNFISKDISNKILPLIKEKISYFGEIEALLNGELSFVDGVGSYDKESLKWKQEKDLVNTKEYLKMIIEKLNSIDDFSKESVKAVLWPLAEEKGKGNILWPMRFALSGKEKSPDPFIISEILGKQETIKRLKFAYELL
jgi:glutamyl-tRNA synthetase